MMRKPLTALVAVAGLFLFGASAFADNVSDPSSDISTWEVVGSTNKAVAISSVGVLNAQDGLFSYHEHFDLPPAISTTAIFRTPAITTTSILAGASTYTTGFTQPVYPHALVAALWFDIGTATVPAISTMTVTGVDAQGKVFSYTQYVSSTPSVTAAAFAKVTAITFSAVSTVSVPTNTNIWFAVGSTGTYGLAASFESSADIYKAKAWNVDATSITYNIGWDTFSLPANAGLSPVDLWIRNTRSSPPRPK